MTHPLRIDVEITADDRRAFRLRVAHQVRLASAPHRLRGRLGFAAMCVAIGAVLFLSDRWRGPAVSSTTWLAVLLVGAGLAALFVIFYQAEQKAASFVILADADARTPRRATYLFDAEGVRRLDEQRDGLLRWAAIAGLDETDKHLFVMHSLTAGWIFPKRLLAASELDAVRELVRSRAGQPVGARVVPPEGLEPSTR
jgi:hypothetical protein